MPAIPSALFIRNCPTVISRMKQKRVNQITVPFGQIGIYRHPLSICGNRAVEIALFFQDGPQIVEQLRMIQLERDRTAKRRDRLV